MSETSLTLPNGWAQKPLSSLIDGLESGVSVNADDRPSIGLELGVLKTSSVSGGKFFPGEHKAVWEKDRKRVRRTPSAGSIIISRMNTPDLVGESGYVLKDENQLFLPDRLWQTVARTGCDADFRWLAQVLQWPPVKKKIKDAATGTSNSMKNISKYSLLRLEVPVPPAIEQRRIAEILSTLDEQIEQTEALVQKQSAFKLGLMKQLLEPGDDWGNPLALGSLVTKGGGSIQTGPFGSQLHERDYVSDGTPIITVEHILTGEVRGNDAPKVSQKDVQRLSRYQLREGDIVFSRVGAIDRSAYVDVGHNGWLFSGRLLRVRPGAAANSRFLAYLLGYDKQQRWIYNHSVGSTMLCLNTSILASVPIRLPRKFDQEYAVELLDSVTAELNLARAALQKLSLLKQGLMRDLLTGKTRVNQLEKRQ